MRKVNYQDRKPSNMKKIISLSKSTVKVWNHVERLVLFLLI